MGSPATLVILAEDLQHQVFLRKFLIGIGLNPQRFRLTPLPDGLRSGEQFVRENYPAQFQLHRQRAKRLDVKLVVVTDSDTLSVDGRLRQLSQALTSAGESDRASDEAVAILIPKRNIETWIAYLMGQPVDETTVYPKLVREGACQPAVDQLVALYRSGWTIPDDCPDSLRRGIEELKRIL